MSSTYRKVRGVASNFGSKNGNGASSVLILKDESPTTKQLGAPALLLLLAIRRKKENNEPITPDDIQALKDRVIEIEKEIANL